MKRFYLLMVVVCIAYATSAQNVGIGTATPDASAQLDVSSTTKGMLAPRMTMAQRDAITSPATGLLIFQTDNTPGFYYFNGTVWAAITENGSGQYWSLTGNSGTDSLTNFIGTTDNQPLVFRINDTIAGLLGNNGNVFFGKESGAGNTTGYSNVAIGNHALFSNTGISNLVAIGDSALFKNGIGAGIPFQGIENTAIGSKALFSNTTGFGNTAIGYQSLKSNTWGAANTGIGRSTLSQNTTGYSNTAIGYGSLDSNVTGNDNTAIGYNSLYRTISNSNTAIGSGTMYFNTRGEGNTATGARSLHYNTTGNANTAIGIDALRSNQTGSWNVAIGNGALLLNDSADYNTAVGAHTLTWNNSGTFNVALGVAVLSGNKDGSNNTGVGRAALYLNVSGFANTGCGSEALYANETGLYNTALGRRSLALNKSGNYNTALGTYADVEFDNLDNATAIGANSLVSAPNSMVLGSINGINNATADTKVGIGITAPGHFLHVKGQSAPDGITQLCLEEELAANFARVKFKNTGQASYWDIAAKVDGALANSRMNFYLDGTGEILSLHGDGNAVLMGALTQNSDMRMKTNIHLLTHSLTSLLTLKGYYYQWKDKHRDQDMQIGLLAQEVEQLFPELVEADKNGALSVNYIGLIPVMIEAIKEQQTSIDKLEKKAEQNEIPAIVGKQQKTIELQQKQVATLTGLIKTLQKKVEMLKEKME